MTIRHVTRHLEDRGFKRSVHPCGYPDFFTLGEQAVVVDCMKVRSYRFFLGLKCIPANHPRVGSIQRGQIDAESPWFRYRSPETKAQALAACVSWFDSVGLPFLADPFAKDLHRWITEEKILIYDNGVIIPIPRVMKLP